MNVEKTTMEYLFHVESQAEKILNEKSEIISLDKIRNNNRMAIRALMNCKIPQGKTWMAVGPIMVKVSIEKAKEILQKGTFYYINYLIVSMTYKKCHKYYFQSKFP